MCIWHFRLHWRPGFQDHSLKGVCVCYNVKTFINSDYNCKFSYCIRQPPKEKLPLHKFSKCCFSQCKAKHKPYSFLQVSIPMFSTAFRFFLQKSHYTQYNCLKPQGSLSILHLSESAPIAEIHCLFHLLGCWDIILNYLVDQKCGRFFNHILTLNCLKILSR